MTVAPNYSLPALHNAMWPGLVGKGPDSEPPIELETMLNLTAAAEVDGQRFEGVDLFLASPHTDIDSSDDDLARLAENLRSKNLLAGAGGGPPGAANRGGPANGEGGGGGRGPALLQKERRGGGEAGPSVRPHPGVWG